MAYSYDPNDLSFNSIEKAVRWYNDLSIRKVGKLWNKPPRRGIAPKSS